MIVGRLQRNTTARRLSIASARHRSCTGESEDRAERQRWHGDPEEGPDMGRPTHDARKRPGRDDTTRLTSAAKAEPLRGRLASESRREWGL